MTEHETGALPALPGEGAGMSTPGELFEQLAVAVEALERIADPTCMVRHDHPDGGGWIDTEAPARIAENALGAIRGTV